MKPYGTWDDCPLCNTGQRQSPIDIVATKQVNSDLLEFSYVSHCLHIANTGMSIKICGDLQCYVTYNEMRYDLLQYHFHHPAEHTINGKEYPLELHFVHENQYGQLLVVAVMIEAGESNSAFSMLSQHFPQNSGDEDNNDLSQIDPTDLLPDDIIGYYHYEGSLTTPPCTEGVQWLILANPLKIGQEQIDCFAAIYKQNNRPIQQSNGRDVFQQS